VIEKLAQTDCGQHRVTGFEQRPTSSAAGSSRR
jgi:hypothetical protein